jgi:hypothetical protein
MPRPELAVLNAAALISGTSASFSNIPVWVGSRALFLNIVRRQSSNDYLQPSPFSHPPLSHPAKSTRTTESADISSFCATCF